MLGKEIGSPMIATLVSMHEKGAITADQLVSQSLRMIDVNDPGLVLGALPSTMHGGIMEYIKRYQPGRMVSTYGDTPTAEQVDAARNWIADHAGSRSLASGLKG